MIFFFLSLLEQTLIIPVAKIYFFNLIISNQLIFSLTFLFNCLKKKEIQRAQISIHWLNDFIKNILNFKSSTSLLLLRLNLIELKPYVLAIVLYRHLALGAAEGAVVVAAPVAEEAIKAIAEAKTK
jgi:hypothetical protein